MDQALGVLGDLLLFLLAWFPLLVASPIALVIAHVSLTTTLVYPIATLFLSVDPLFFLVTRKLVL